MGVLDETRNLLRVYQSAAGQYHTPQAFHRWSCLSLVSASAGDRVYLVRFRHSPLLPNLFVFLVGPSGLGKDHATGFARSCVSDEADGWINTFAGRLTQAYLSDTLVYNQRRKDRPEGDSGASIWLVQSELFADLPGGELTKTLVADLVRLYQGSGSNIVLNATRMHGVRAVARGPCINWLGGSTPEWFAKSITPDVFDSGYAGRSILVCETRDYSKRYASPIYPDDYDDLMEHLRARVEAVATTKGQFGIDAQALAIEERWVQGRAAPGTDQEAKVWDRQHVMSIKLAMVLVLCERTEPLVIEARHMAAAQRLVTETWQAQAAVAEVVHASREGGAYRMVRGKIKSSREMRRGPLLRHLGKMGVSAETLAGIIMHLVEAGEVTVEERFGGVSYRWIGE